MNGGSSRREPLPFLSSRALDFGVKQQLMQLRANTVSVFTLG